MQADSRTAVEHADELRGALWDILYDDQDNVIAPHLFDRAKAAIDAYDAAPPTEALEAIKGLQRSLQSRERRTTDLRARLQVYREGYREADFECLSRRIQLSAAMNHLFRILDGNDRDAAIEAARGWLEKYFSQTCGYATRSAIACTEGDPALVALAGVGLDTENVQSRL